MKYGIFSGALWGLDTVVLSMALVMLPFGAPEAAMASALLHDVLCAIITNWCTWVCEDESATLSPPSKPEW